MNKTVMTFNTDTARSKVRAHFGVQGDIKVTIEFNPRTGSPKFYIYGVLTERGMPYFNDLKVLMMEAEAELEVEAKARAEEKLEEDLLIGITQLRELS